MGKRRAKKRSIHVYALLAGFSRTAECGRREVDLLATRTEQLHGVHSRRVGETDGQQVLIVAVHTGTRSKDTPFVLLVLRVRWTRNTHHGFEAGRSEDVPSVDHSVYVTRVSLQLVLVELRYISHSALSLTVIQVTAVVSQNDAQCLLVQVEIVVDAVEVERVVDEGLLDLAQVLVFPPIAEPRDPGSILPIVKSRV